MQTIRLQRVGKKNKPHFRIILAEKASAASKKFQEILGSYNPQTKEFTIKDERVKYWISQRVELSPTVHNLLVTHKIIDETKVRAFVIPPKEASESSESEPSANNDTPTEGAEKVADSEQAESKLESKEAESTEEAKNSSADQKSE